MRKDGEFSCSIQNVLAQVMPLHAKVANEHTCCTLSISTELPAAVAADVPAVVAVAAVAATAASPLAAFLLPAFLPPPVLPPDTVPPRVLPAWEAVLSSGSGTQWASVPASRATSLAVIQQPVMMTCASGPRPSSPAPSSSSPPSPPANMYGRDSSHSRDLTAHILIHM